MTFAYHLTCSDGTCSIISTILQCFGHAKYFHKQEEFT